MLQSQPCFPRQAPREGQEGRVWAGLWSSFYLQNWMPAGSSACPVHTAPSPMHPPCYAAASSPGDTPQPAPTPTGPLPAWAPGSPYSDCPCMTADALHQCMALMPATCSRLEAEVGLHLLGETPAHPRASNCTSHWEPACYLQWQHHPRSSQGLPLTQPMHPRSSQPCMAPASPPLTLLLLAAARCGSAGSAVPEAGYGPAQGKGAGQRNWAGSWAERSRLQAAG